MTLHGLLFAGLLLTAANASATDLTIGRATEQAALDPQYSDLGNDVATAQNMFERLVSFDPNLQMHPGLAVAWSMVDPLTWELKLRPGVHYHDGTKFSAEDVVFGLKRARNQPTSPGPLTTLVSSVRDAEVIDPLTVRVHTVKPAPLLMEQIGQIFFVPAKLGPAVATEDFNSGRAMIGTGPYRFRSAAPGDRVVMQANPDYWGEKPRFDTITLKFISNDAARSAALLSGGVDVIEAIPPTDVPALEAREGITLSSIGSTRVVYIAIDSARETSPFVTDKDGKPMTVNPLRDRRVRIALSKMLNRDAIVERVVSGAGIASGQMAPEGMGGYDPALKPPAFDPAGAKRLLAEAGYPDGFGLTLHGSSNRFPKDAQLAQGIGQMWTRGGIRMNAIEVLPYNVYTPAATARKFSVFIFSYGNVTSSSQPALMSLIHTYDAVAGVGQLNRARYSNTAFDALMGHANETFDAPKRNALFAEATRLAMDDGALLPLY